MADKEKLPRPSEQNPPQRPIHEAEERSLKPTPKPNTHTKDKKEK